MDESNSTDIQSSNQFEGPGSILNEELPPLPDGELPPFPLAFINGEGGPFRPPFANGELPFPRAFADGEALPFPPAFADGQAPLFANGEGLPFPTPFANDRQPGFGNPLISGAISPSDGENRRPERFFAPEIRSNFNQIQGTENIDNLIGTVGSDAIAAGGGNDVLTGLDGNDLLLGGSGNDILAGDAGNDTLIGGLGSDTLTGGAGEDAFVMHRNWAEDIPSQDVITDFELGIDRLLLLGGLAATLALSSDPTIFDFVEIDLSGVPPVIDLGDGNSVAITFV